MNRYRHEKIIVRGKKSTHLFSRSPTPAHLIIQQTPKPPPLFCPFITLFPHTFLPFHTPLPSFKRFEQLAQFTLPSSHLILPVNSQFTIFIQHTNLPTPSHWRYLFPAAYHNHLNSDEANQTKLHYVDANIIKGHLCYKTTTSQNVSSEA